MTQLTLRPASECTYDAVVLGEVMLRFDPGTHRIRTAREFTISEGGGEYNVGRALRRVFSQRSALVTAIGNNELGWLLEDFLLQSGLTLDHVVWKDTDDRGHHHRNPLYFAERGFGRRPPRAVFDRSHSATSALAPDDVDWDHIFGTLGVRWFHTGGIFAGLSDTTYRVAVTAMDAARRHGTVVSFDVNYRPKLWSASGGTDAALRQAEEFAARADVVFGVADLAEAVSSQTSTRPRLIANLVRTTHSASRHDLAARAWADGVGYIDSPVQPNIDVLDRIGSGDAFAAGVIAELLNGSAVQHALNVGVAHAAIAMTTAGDTSSSDPEEIRQLLLGASAQIER